MNRFSLVLSVLGLIAFYGAGTSGWWFNDGDDGDDGELDDNDLYAACNLTPDPAYTGDQITGSVLFRQSSSSVYGQRDTEVVVRLSGFSTDGEHGIHIHQYGDMSNGCSSCGGHYNPEGQDHGAPDAKVRHVGDLGNVEAKDGNVNVFFYDRKLKLSGSNDIVGRSVVFHEGVDDLGMGGYSDSLTTGHAGARMGCCIIGTSDGTEWAAVTEPATEAP